MTDSILMMAPRAIRLHMELIISISEYSAHAEGGGEKAQSADE